MYECVCGVYIYVCVFICGVCVLCIVCTCLKQTTLRIFLVKDKFQVDPEVKFRQLSS